MEAAAKHSVPQVYMDLDEMLEKSGIDLLVDTTHIQAHFDVNLRALRAGKHVYGEKPMTGTVQEATVLIEEALRDHDEVLRRGGDGPHSHAGDDLLALRREMASTL